MRMALVVAVAVVLAGCAVRQEGPVLYEVTPQQGQAAPAWAEIQPAY